jgi:hypothetical protein
MKRDYDVLVDQEKQVLQALCKLTGSSWECLSRYDCVESVELENQSRAVKRLVEEYFLLQKDKGYIDEHIVLDCSNVTLEDVISKHRYIKAFLNHILFDICVTGIEDIKVIESHIKSLGKYITNIKEKKPCSK